MVTVGMGIQWQGTITRSKLSMAPSLNRTRGPVGKKTICPVKTAIAPLFRYVSIITQNRNVMNGYH